MTSPPEELATELVQQDSGLSSAPGPAGAVAVALGVSGDKPCGETTKMGEETSVEESQDATTATSLATTPTTTSSITTTSNTNMSPQEIKWIADEQNQFLPPLPSFQLSMSKDGSNEDRVSVCVEVVK